MPSKRVPKSTYQFDPQSLDAQLAGIHAAVTTMSERMDERFNGVDARCIRIEEQAVKTNGRVTSLEFFRDTSKAKMAGVAAALGAFGGMALAIVKAAFAKIQE